MQKKKITSILCIALCAVLCACSAQVPSDILYSTQNPESTNDTIATIEDSHKDNGSDLTSDTGTESQSESGSHSQSAADTSTETDTPKATDSTTNDKTDTTPPEEGPVRIVMVGDILMHDPVIASGKQGTGYNFDHLFSNIRDEISSADIAMLNQEVIIAGEKYGIQGYPRFNSPFELADAIADAGFDVALHATNHTLDKGADAMRDCLDYWRGEHPEVKVLGMHASEQEAREICVIEKNGIRIAVLNYTYYAINPAGQSAIDKEPYLVDRLIESEVTADLRAADAAADFTVVAVHWGTEYKHTPSQDQKKWAALFLREGVDLVLGTHPHVLQPVEWLKGSDGQRMLVYWSLGNFVNCTESSGKGIGARMLGAMSDVTIEKDEKGNVYISEASAIPLITHITSAKGGITTYRFDAYTQDMLQKNLATEKDSGFTYSYIVSHYDEMLGEFMKKKQD